MAWAYTFDSSSIIKDELIFQTHAYPLSSVCKCDTFVQAPQMLSYLSHLSLKIPLVVHLEFGLSFFTVLSCACINITGKLEEILEKHTGSIFSLQWNKRGDLLLTGSFDNTAILWDTGTWECKQQFAFHSGEFFQLLWILCFAVGPFLAEWCTWFLFLQHHCYLLCLETILHLQHAQKTRWFTFATSESLSQFMLFLNIRFQHSNQWLIC